MDIFQKKLNNFGKLVLFLCLLGACMFLCIKEGQCENNEVTQGTIRVGFSSKYLNDVSQADAIVAISLWAREIGKNTTLRMQTKPTLYDSWQSMAHALKSREIDFIALTAIDYLRIKDKVPLEPVLVGSKRGTVGDEMVLIVRRGQGITDIGQLKGKRLVVQDNFMVDMAYLWLDTVLNGKHLPDRERLFGSIREVKKASQAVLPVFFKQADVCLVSKSGFDMMVELNPQLGKELMVLSSSDKLLFGMFCFNKQLSADVKAQITKTALNMDTNPAGKQILTLFQLDIVRVFQPDMLNTTIALLAKQNKQGEKSLTK